MQQRIWLIRSSVPDAACLTLVASVPVLATIRLTQIAVWYDLPAHLCPMPTSTLAPLGECFQQLHHAKACYPLGLDRASPTPSYEIRVQC